MLTQDHSQDHQKPYSVTAITATISQLIQQADVLQDVWVTGEVSNLRKAASGHWYFTLKDNNAQLRCVMFKSATMRQRVEPRDGDAVNIRGHIGVYEARGEYQLYATRILAVGGVGDLYQQFDLLKQKLESEGLFAQERKRALPVFPLRIGVVTSPDAAAFRDIQNVLARRFPVAQVILSPTLVQGNEAPPRIVKAIERINAYGDVDVLLVARGGGSIEDLWCFNDEQVARAIANSAIPTISGVGHETDFTIADFVADMRAPTPSAAAEIAVPDISELRAGLRQLQTVMVRHMQDRLQQHRTTIAQAVRGLGYGSPQNAIGNYRQRIDDFSERIHAAQKRDIALKRERLAARLAALNAANPDAILARGYAIVTRSDDDRIITSEQDVTPGTGLIIRLQDGELAARVEDKDSHGKYKRTLF